MKKANFLNWAIGLCAIALASCSQQPGKEIRSGELWLDQDSVHVNAHGGGVLYHDGTYYWYGENKCDTTSSAMVGIMCYSSTNLTDWVNHGAVLPVVENDTTSDIIKGCIMERPKVIYNESTGKFVMWFHLELKGKGYAAARSAVAVADSPTGPFEYLGSGRINPGILPMNMTDEQKAILDTLDAKKYEQWWTPAWYDAIEKGLFVKRDLEGGQMARDMQLFVDDDGKAYHIYSSEDNLTLQIAELSDDYLSHTGKYIRFAPAGHNEAPALFKKDGTYWMITSGCTGWAPNEARMFSAESIWGPWKEWPNPCVGPNADLTFGGQSTYALRIPGKDGKEHFIFMADIWRPQHPSDARYIWLPIQFHNGRPIVEWKESWTLDDLLNGNITENLTPTDSILLSDPCILADKETGKYYMTGTGGKMWESSDLKMWTGPYDVTMTSDVPWMGRAPEIWAAELHKYNGKYYYFATFTNKGIKVDNNLDRRACHVLVSDNPGGPYKPMQDPIYLPEDKLTLDGTLWVDTDNKPYMVYCHEWLQNNNGTIEKIELKPDLSGTVGDGKILFRASDSPWSHEVIDGKEGPNRVTDGPFLFRTETGKLGMIWTSWVDDVYTQGVAYSQSGTLDGPWVQEKEPITPPNYGHGMLFQTLDGKWLMSVHSHLNEGGKYIRIPHLFEVDLSGDKLVVGPEYHP